PRRELAGDPDRRHGRGRAGGKQLERGRGLPESPGTVRDNDGRRRSLERTGARTGRGRALPQTERRGQHRRGPRGRLRWILLVQLEHAPGASSVVRASSPVYAGQGAPFRAHEAADARRPVIVGTNSMPVPLPKMYSEIASWWPLLSKPEDHRE